MIDDHLNAFCRDSDAFLAGVDGDGPLAGLRFAAKDIFDIADTSAAAAIRTGRPRTS